MLNAEYYWAHIAQEHKLVHVIELDFSTEDGWNDMLVLYSAAQKEFYWASGESYCTCCGFDWGDITTLDEMSSGTVVDVVLALTDFWNSNSRNQSRCNYDSKEQFIRKIEAFVIRHEL